MSDLPRNNPSRLGVSRKDGMYFQSDCLENSKWGLSSEPSVCCLNVNGSIRSSPFCDDAEAMGDRSAEAKNRLAWEGPNECPSGPVDDPSWGLARGG